MNKIIELLKRTETILITAKAPESDLKNIRELIKHLKPVRELPHDKFYNYIKNYSIQVKQPEKNVKKLYSLPKLNLEEIVTIYKKIRSKRSLNDSEKESINIFETKHPKIRNFLLGDLKDLYDRVSEVDEKMWNIEELRLLLLFHFDFKPSQKKKSDLLSELKKNIYSFNYMNSMKRQYEGKTENGMLKEKDDVKKKAVAQRK